MSDEQYVMGEPNFESNEEVTESYHDYVMPVWKNLNVPVEEAEGSRYRDFDGGEYVDLFAGISVTNAGHRNEAVVEAAKEQLDELVHCCSYVHPNEPVAALAERLAEITPGDLEKTFFCNSGTEAVEGSIKLARKYTGSKEVVALEMGFHGRTLGSLALTGNHTYKKGMAPTIGDVVQAPAPYQYRSMIGEEDDEKFAEKQAAKLDHVLGTHTSKDLAAIVLEPVLGEGGIIVPPEGYLKEVKKVAVEHDALLIADEVQTGYGRTGKMWAVDHFDITPDIILQAKGIADGLPLGAFTARAEIADSFESGDHLSTFGGNPVSCAAANACIDELQDGIIENAELQGEYLELQLLNLEDEYEVVGDTRGLGLMRGIEFVDPGSEGPHGNAPAPDAELASRINESLLEDYEFIAGVGGYYKNVLRIQPPLVIERDDLERFVDALEEILENET
ncbi:MAG: aspartate aminotransferase family protein [Halobacteria archaeon]